MTITYAPCNFCGTKLVKHQADLTNAGVKGFECPLKLESDRQERNLAKFEEDVKGWDEVAGWSETVEETVERFERAGTAFDDIPLDLLIPKPDRPNFKAMAAKIHEASKAVNS